MNYASSIGDAVSRPVTGSVHHSRWCMIDGQGSVFCITLRWCKMADICIIVDGAIWEGNSGFVHQCRWCIRVNPCINEDDETTGAAVGRRIRNCESV